MTNFYKIKNNKIFKMGEGANFYFVNTPTFQNEDEAVQWIEQNDTGKKFIDTQEEWKKAIENGERFACWYEAYMTMDEFKNLFETGYKFVRLGKICETTKLERNGWGFWDVYYMCEGKERLLPLCALYMEMAVIYNDK